MPYGADATNQRVIGRRSIKRWAGIWNLLVSKTTVVHRLIKKNSTVPAIHSTKNLNSNLLPQDPATPLPGAASPIQNLPIEVFQNGISNNLSVRDLSAVYLTGGAVMRGLVQESWNRISNPDEPGSLTRDPNRGPGVRQAALILVDDLEHDRTQLDEATIKQIATVLEDVVMPEHHKVSVLKPVIEAWIDKLEGYQLYFVSEHLKHLAQYRSTTLQSMGLETLAEKLATRAPMASVPLFDHLLSLDPSQPTDATPVKDLFSVLARNYHGVDLHEKVRMDERKKRAVLQFLAQTQSEQKRPLFKYTALQAAASVVPGYVNYTSAFMSQSFQDSQQKVADLLFKKIYDYSGQLGSPNYRNQVCETLREEIGWLRLGDKEKQAWLDILAAR